MDVLGDVPLQMNKAIPKDLANSKQKALNKNINLIPSQLHFRSHLKWQGWPRKIDEVSVFVERGVSVLRVYS